MNTYIHMCIYIYIYIYVCVYIYIYTLNSKPYLFTLGKVGPERGGSENYGSERG